MIKACNVNDVSVASRPAVQFSCRNMTQNAPQLTIRRAKNKKIFLWTGNSQLPQWGHPSPHPILFGASIVMLTLGRREHCLQCIVTRALLQLTLTCCWLVWCDGRQLLGVQSQLLDNFNHYHNWHWKHSAAKSTGAMHTCAGVSDSLMGWPSKRKRMEPIFTPCQHESFTSIRQHITQTHFTVHWHLTN